MQGRRKRLDLILEELRTHLPYTLMGVGIAIVFLAAVYWIIIRLGHRDEHATLENLFHLSHFAHIFLSAIATTAVFYRNENNVLKTTAVAFFSTFFACGLSDLILPYAGGFLLGAQMHLHICLIKEPVWTLLICGLGIWVGLLSEVKWGKISYLGHGSHVFVSSFASLFYLVTFGLENWVPLIAGIFIITVVAVVIPCCSSDIIIPLSFVTGVHGHEHEDEHTQQHPHPHP